MDRRQARHGPATAWGELLKDLNGDKLRIILGQEPAERLLRRLEAERTFAQTRNETLGGSMTEMRRQSAAELGDFREIDSARRPGPVQLVFRGANDAVNSVLDAIMRPGVNRRNQQLGQALGAQGSRRDMLIKALQTQSFRQRQGTSADPTIQAIVRALMHAAPAAGQQASSAVSEQ